MAKIREAETSEEESRGSCAEVGGEAALKLSGAWESWVGRDHSLFFWLLSYLEHGDGINLLHRGRIKQLLTSIAKMVPVPKKDSVNTAL